MRKRKSTRETKNMIQTALWLPHDMHEQLKKDGGERGLGDEIRRRLQVSFGVEQQPRDKPTDLLLDLIKRIALNLSRDEEWWANRFALGVFKTAINELLSDMISIIGPSEPLPGTITKLQTRYGPDEKPETIGRILARAAFVENANEQLRLLLREKRITIMAQGHIRPQGDGSWEIKFDLGRDPLTGRRITKYVTFRGTKRKAQEELTRLLGQRNEGTYVEPTKMTVTQYLHHWLEADIDRRVAARTAARYRGIVEKNIIPKLGHVPVRKLTAVHIEAFEAELQREGWVKARAKQKIKEGEEAPIQEKRGLSSQTALHVHRVLSQALSHAVRLGVLFKNPARQVKPPRPPSREIKILDKNEITTLINAAKGVGLYVPVLVAVTTGMRRGELLGAALVGYRPKGNVTDG